MSNIVNSYTKEVLYKRIRRRLENGYFREINGKMFFISPGFHSITEASLKKCLRHLKYKDLYEYYIDTWDNAWG